MSEAAMQETKALRVAVVVYLVIFVLKLVVFMLSGVMALLAEALHTLSDIFVSVFLLIAAVWSRRPPDEQHPYGHGRAQYVGALVAATLFISFTALELYREAIPGLLRKVHPTPSHLWLAIGVLVASMLIAMWPLVSLLRKRLRGAAARAQLLELVNDQLGLAAALVGTLCLKGGFPIADPISSLAVALIITVNGGLLFRENLSYLLGRSPGPAFMEQLRAIAGAVEGVVSLHGARAHHVAPEEIHAEIHLAVQRGLPIEAAHRIAVRARQAVLEGTPCTHCVVHVDPQPE